MRKHLVGLALALVTAAGCYASGDRFNTYQQFEANDRIYVVGKTKTFSGLDQSNPHLPYTRTLVGAGPGGKTVIFEADPKDVLLQRQLIRLFNKKNGTTLPVL